MTTSVKAKRTRKIKAPKPAAIPRSRKYRQPKEDMRGMTDRQLAKFAIEPHNPDTGTEVWPEAVMDEIYRRANKKDDANIRAYLASMEADTKPVHDIPEEFVDTFTLIYTETLMQTGSQVGLLPRLKVLMNDAFPTYADFISDERTARCYLAALSGTADNFKKEEFIPF